MGVSRDSDAGNEGGRVVGGDSGGSLASSSRKGAGQQLCVGGGDYRTGRWSRIASSVSSLADRQGPVRARRASIHTLREKEIRLKERVGEGKKDPVWG